MYVLGVRTIECLHTCVPAIPADVDILLAVINTRVEIDIFEGFTDAQVVDQQTHIVKGGIKQ